MQLINAETEPTGVFFFFGAFKEDFLWNVCGSDDYDMEMTSVDYWTRTHYESDHQIIFIF